jgi:hypothetical protein
VTPAFKHVAEDARHTHGTENRIVRVPGSRTHCDTNQRNDTSAIGQYSN